MKIKEIFTPGRFPTWTYVDDHLKIKEEQLHDALDDGSMLVSISGPSKSGKTVFVEHILGKENLIQITGAGVRTPSDLWIRVFDIIGTPVTKTITVGDSSANTVGLKGGVEGNVFVFKGKAELSSSKVVTSQENRTETEAIDFLQLLISELAETDFVIFIDDFHYIHREVQAELAQQIKEAIRQGVKFICASVPYHSDDVIRSNPDLRGRIFSIDFDYWGKNVLEKIARKGFQKANIAYQEEMTNKLVDETAGSPQLMQYLCLNSCFEKGVRDVPETVVDLSYEQGLFEDICRRTVASADYSSVVDKMIADRSENGV